MNIIIRELKANLKPLIIWSVAQMFVILSGMMKYKGYADSGVDINSLFGDGAEGLLKAFGMNGLDLSKVDAYYTVFFLYFMLLAAIHAVMLGAVLISKEERDHSADFLFSKPVKRYQVVTSKLIAGSINIFVFNIVTYVTSVVMIATYNDGDGLSGKVGLLMVALFILQVFFLALGAMFGAVLKTTKIATSAATGFVLATFFMSILADISEKVDFLKYLTPFKAFQSRIVIFDGELSLVSTAILLALSAGLLAVTYKKFHARDLTT